jgi:hypothetical protein
MPKATFSVTCTTAGAKAFSATVTATTDEVHVSDPTSGNATSSGQANTNVSAAGLPPTGGNDSALPGGSLSLLLLLPLAAIIASAGLLTFRRNRRGSVC